MSQRDDQSSRRVDSMAANFLNGRLWKVFTEEVSRLSDLWELAREIDDAHVVPTSRPQRAAQPLAPFPRTHGLMLGVIYDAVVLGLARLADPDSTFGKYDNLNLARVCREAMLACCPDSKRVLEQHLQQSSFDFVRVAGSDAFEQVRKWGLAHLDLRAWTESEAALSIPKHEIESAMRSIVITRSAVFSQLCSDAGQPLSNSDPSFVITRTHEYDRELEALIRALMGAHGGSSAE